MKLYVLLFVLFMGVAGIAQAQVPAPHSTPESRQKAKLRMDYSTFRREINALKEFAEERKKIPALQKEQKAPVKVVATIDSIETEDDAKVTTLTGYITQIIGENSSNAYEVTFDRATRKITQVKRTTEAVEPEATAPAAKPAAKKPAPKAHTSPKKDDDDADDEEEKAPAGKEKDDE
ncbi:MAG: hypothetical protein EBZ77_10215 [Chitinophagia bacterium]|nr:hypothetical protein [Chitinophagia bacterium]